VQELMADIRTIRPTALVSVPRIYERAHAVLHATVDRSPISRRLFQAAVSLGYRRFESLQGRARKLSLPARLMYSLLDVLVARKVREQFGGRLRVAVTGGAAMAVEVAHPLLAMGLPLLQGYGMTESSPVIACNTPQDNDPSTVGRALPGIQVRIGEQDELLTRSDSVMLGYWKRPDETDRVIDADGWLHTGDQAQIVDGRIRIKGRIKDIIVTSTGEKVAPGDIESAIMGDPLFEQVMVLGEQRPYLSAIVVLNRESWKPWAQGLGLDPINMAQLRSDAATQWVLARIAQLVKGFPSYSTPKAVFLTTEPWTVASGLLTPTLKPKRAAITARFAEDIGRLYRGH
jgi:long-chain acyl-CoA synthetase